MYVSSYFSPILTNRFSTINILVSNIYRTAILFVISYKYQYFSSKKIEFITEHLRKHLCLAIPYINQFLLLKNKVTHITNSLKHYLLHINMEKKEREKEREKEE